MCYKTNLASCISMEINSVGIWNLHRVKIEIIIVVCKIYQFKYFCEILVWNLSYKMIWLSCNQRKLIFLNSSIFNYFRIPNRCQLRVTCPFWHLSFCSFSMYRFQNSTCNLMASYSLNFVDFFFYLQILIELFVLLFLVLLILFILQVQLFIKFMVGYFASIENRIPNWIEYHNY